MAAGRRRRVADRLLRAGFAAQAICAARRIPLQAELGGNNAAIVWSDCDLAAAAAAIAEAGFGAAGQRCTANRRVIVADDRHAEFVGELEAASAALEIGDPSDPGVHVGPWSRRQHATAWPPPSRARARSSRCASRCAIATRCGA